MTARQRNRTPQVPAPVTAGSPEGLDWPGLKATYTKALDYRHICSYDGPVVDCPVCFDETDVELKRRSDR